MSVAPQPIFLLSLPRSGSTLIQRVIGAHPAVATVSEPWLLLPLLSSLERDMCAAKYGHELLVEAMSDLCRQLPRGLDDYYAAVRSFASTIYERLTNDGQHYFLDKTPRYHLVARRVVECFPDAKVVLVWRNPLAVASSGIHSYGGVWRGRIFKVDLYEGLLNLIDVYRDYADRIYAVRFEDVIAAPEEEFRKIFRYLKLDFDPDLIDNFTATHLQGKMGDKSGSGVYTTLNAEPLEKWKHTLSNPTRRAWARRYLRWLGSERLRVMGYEMADLLHQLNEAPTTWKGVPSDLIRMAYSEFLFQFTPGFKDQFGTGAKLECGEHARAKDA
jgi:hypothetical protein